MGGQVGKAPLVPWLIGIGSAEGGEDGKAGVGVCEGELDGMREGPVVGYDGLQDGRTEGRRLDGK